MRRLLLLLLLLVVFAVGAQEPSGAMLPSYDSVRSALPQEGYDYETGFALEEQASGMQLYTESPTHVSVAQPALKLGYKHMSKCGGSYLVQLLRNMTRGMPGVLNTFFFDERYAVTPARHNGTYIIASVRNPCDYYVSLWAYQSQKPWAAEQNAAHGGTLWQPEATTCGLGSVNCPLQPESANSDPNMFEAWMNLTLRTNGRSAGSPHGILTYRFWDQLVKQHDSLQCWADNMLECADSFDDAEVSTGMANFNPEANIDCWIRTERFDDDVKRCLNEYEHRSGVKLNWTAFNARVPDVNKAGHAPCDSC